MSISRTLPVVALASAAIAVGIFFYVTDASAYLGRQASTCNNCHVMDAAYENWFHGGHAQETECVDCHLPHDNPADYYFEKGLTGFHNPEYILKILADSTNLARQAQMLAAQAAHDPSLLETGIYDKMEPKPTPVP